MKIDGTSFFVTGGGSGLGAACVRHFASRGGKVLIADVQEEAGKALAARHRAGWIVSRKAQSGAISLA